MKTGKGVPAPWNSNQQVRAISAIWGGRPFDAALPIGDWLYLFEQSQYSKLATNLASDSVGGAFVVNNLRTALAARSPISSGFYNLPSATLSGLGRGSSS